MTWRQTTRHAMTPGLGGDRAPEAPPGTRVAAGEPALGRSCDVSTIASGMEVAIRGADSRAIGAGVICG